MKKLKYKVGDYVKIIYSGFEERDRKKIIGRIGKIVQIRGSPPDISYPYKIKFSPDIDENDKNYSILTIFCDEELGKATKEEIFLDWCI